MLRQGVIALFVALVAMVHAQVDPNRSVIVINGEEIKGAEYYRRMEFLPQVGRIVGGGNIQEAPPGFLVLQTLIEERLILKLAKDKGVFPTDAEVAELLQERTAVDPGFVDRYVKQGLAKSDLEFQARIELCQFKLQTMGINITDMEIEKHYKDNPSRFVVPKKYKLRMLALADADKAAADADLKAGIAFAEVAKKRSLDPSRIDGGSIGVVPEDAFAESVRKVLEATKIGQTSAWIQGENSWVKFFLENVEPSKTLQLDATLKRDLRKSLMLDKGRVKNDLDKMLKEARAKAVIQLKQPQFDSDIKKLLDSYKLGA